MGESSFEDLVQRIEKDHALAEGEARASRRVATTPSVAEWKAARKTRR